MLGSVAFWVYHLKIFSLPNFILYSRAAKWEFILVANRVILVVESGAEIYWGLFLKIDLWWWILTCATIFILVLSHDIVQQYKILTLVMDQSRYRSRVSERTYFKEKWTKVNFLHFIAETFKSYAEWEGWLVCSTGSLWLGNWKSRDMYDEIVHRWHAIELLAYSLGNLLLRAKCP